MTTYSEWSSSQDSVDVTVDGHDLEVAYRDEGSGDPVVLLHGIPTNSFLWRDVIGPIAEERRVIVPDMVGYGNSSMHDGFDRSIRAQEEMIDGLIAGLDLDTASLVGHDLGGGVFLRYAVHRPDAVDELVLSNSIAYDAWPIPAITDLGLPGVAEENDADDVRELLEGMFAESLVGEPDGEFLEGMTAPWTSEEGVVGLVRAAAATNTNHTTEIDPREVDAETLLLWGADDPFQQMASAERLADDIADAELVGLEDANHWVMEDRPEDYRDELAAFLLG